MTKQEEEEARREYLEEIRTATNQSEGEYLAELGKQRRRRDARRRFESYSPILKGLLLPIRCLVYFACLLFARRTRKNPNGEL
jgi:hypothetical protein